MSDSVALATLFTDARTHNGWQDKPVSDELCRQIYDLAKWGPTSANWSPARIVLVRSAVQKEKLLDCMAPGNQDKTRSAPVTAIIGMDMAFYEQLPGLFPHADARAWFVGNQSLIDSTAFRNSTLQGAYLILAARSLGLDCGPMSGFDADKINAIFFPDSSVKVNFICNIGYGDATKLFPRSPRMPFEQACSLV